MISFPKMPPWTRSDPAPNAEPPPSLELDLLLVVMLLGVLLQLAVLLAFGGPWLGYYAVHLWLPLWLLACTVFGGSRLAERPGWLRRGVRVARGQFMEYGGGFYGAVAAIAFMWLEWARIVEVWDFIATRPGIHEWIRHVIDFGIDSFKYGISAVAWPAFHAKAFAMRSFWPAAGIGAGVFSVAQALMAWLPAGTRPEQDAA